MINRSPSFFDASVKLKHFSIISYTVDPNLLQKYLPKFLVPELIMEGKKSVGLVSAVTFCDSDFSFTWMGPIKWFDMWQTNFRAYVIDIRDGSRCVWFFQTMLGSLTSYVPKILWKMPWHNSRYKSKIGQKNWVINGISSSSDDVVSIDINIDINDTKNISSGFKSIEDAKHILCNPSKGYYKKNNGKIGFYTIWHNEINLVGGCAQNIFLSTFSRLGLVIESSFNNPHSIICQSEVDFKIYLPPKEDIAQQADSPDRISPVIVATTPARKITVESVQ